MKFLILFFILHGFTCLYASNAEAKPIKVVVIDSGLRIINIPEANLCPSEHLDLTGEGIDDKDGHGTNVTGLIVGNAGDPAKYCIVIIKAFKIVNGVWHSFVPQAINYAVDIQADIVNISGGGYGSNINEQFAVERLLKTKAILVVAAGNERTNLDKSCKFFPACYDPRIVVVGATESFSNYGKKVVDIAVSGKDRKAFGITKTGSSQSTAVVTGRIIKNLAIKKKIR